MSKSKVKSFAVGDRVSWKSQAAGIWKQKTGTIVEVVPANQFPQKMGETGIRAHESYVVSVIHSPTTKPELYHPLVSKLRLVKRGNTSAPKAAARPRPTGVTDPAPESVEGEAIRHTADCPQGGPPRNGEPCCDAVTEEMLARDVQDAQSAIANAN